MFLGLRYYTRTAVGKLIGAVLESEFVSPGVGEAVFVLISGDMLRQKTKISCDSGNAFHSLIWRQSLPFTRCSIGGARRLRAPST